MNKRRPFDNYLLVVVAMFMIIAVAVNYSLTSVFNDPNTNESTETIPTQSPEPEPEFDVEKTAFAAPLDKIDQRVTKKKFGTYVTPQNSPVSPEKFTGYHTGWDFEILDGEENKDVLVGAFCDGKIAYKDSVNGYGGVVIQLCEIDGQAVTVLYGHLRLASIDKGLGDKYQFGDRIGLLGSGYSRETDGERKHLHFSIHKGTNIDLRGYVASQGQLTGWIDPGKYL